MPTEHTSQSEANKNKDKLKQDWEKDKKSTEFGKTNNPNYDPSHQNKGIDAGKPSNPNTPTTRNMNQDEGDLHPIVASDDRLKASGKHVGGLPNQPIVTLNPTSRPVDSQGKRDYEVIDDAIDVLSEGSLAGIHTDFEDIEIGSGILIPVEPGKTIDQTVLEAQKKVHQLNLHYSIPEVNDEGEELMDSVIVKEFKRNEDKTIQLGADNKPITGANAGYITRRIQLRQYAVKNVTRGDKISEDGALIVRVF